MSDEERTVPGKGVLTYLPQGRCPSWSPGNQLKCLGTKGHPGDCWAYRLGSRDQVNWPYRPTPEEENRKEEAQEAADLVSDRILNDMIEDE